MKLDISKITIEKLTNIRPNTWNPKTKNTSEYQKIKQNIKEDGQLTPVIVRENNGLEILDGEQRYTAFKELGIEDIVIYNLGKLSDEKAKAITLWAQYAVPFDELNLADIIHELDNANITQPYEPLDLEDLLDVNTLDIEPLLKDKEEDGLKTLKLLLNENAYVVITDAIDKVKLETGNISNERAIELICADYLGG